MPLVGGVLTIPAGAIVTITEVGGVISIETSPDSSAPALLNLDGAQVPIPPGDSVSLALGCLGDVNGDGVISPVDVRRVARALRTQPGHPRWDPEADLNNDGRVDRADLAIMLSSLRNPTCRGEPPPSCEGDVDGDGRVTTDDLRIVLRAMLSRPGHPRWNPDADLNGHGRVDGKDLRTVLRSLADPSCR